MSYSNAETIKDWAVSNFKLFFYLKIFYFCLTSTFIYSRFWKAKPWFFALHFLPLKPEMYNLLLNGNEYWEEALSLNLAFRGQVKMTSSEEN